MKTLLPLVLMCLLNGEAWAQVKKTGTAAAAWAQQGKVPVRKKPLPRKAHIESTDLSTVTVVSGDDKVTGAAELSELPEVEPSVYAYVRQMPSFAGGYEAMQTFLQKYLRWPKNSGRICAEGRVFINFIVGKEGRLREFRVLKGIHPQLDAEALRVAQLLDGHFMPGKRNGRAVDVYYTVPVTFQIK